MGEDTLYGAFLESGELILGVVREKELYPFHRVPFKVQAVLFPVLGGHGLVNRCGPCDVLLELLPIQECYFVSLFHVRHVYSLSLMYASASLVSSFALSRSSGRSHSMKPVSTLMMSAMPVSCSMFRMDADSLPSMSASLELG